MVGGANCVADWHKSYDAGAQDLANMHTNRNICKFIQQYIEHAKLKYVYDNSDVKSSVCLLSF